MEGRIEAYHWHHYNRYFSHAPFKGEATVRLAAAEEHTQKMQTLIARSCRCCPYHSAVLAVENVKVYAVLRKCFLRPHIFGLAPKEPPCDLTHR